MPRFKIHGPQKNILKWFYYNYPCHHISDHIGLYVIIFLCYSYNFVFQYQDKEDRYFIPIMQWKTVTFAIVLLQILVVITITSGSPLLDKTVSSYTRASVTDYRLPTNVKPIHYKIKLNPLINDTDPTIFTGEVKIRVKIIEETDSITLHYNDLSINTINVIRVNNETDIPVYHEYDNVTHFCVIRINKDGNEDVEETFKTNEEYVITITYSGYHRDDMYGFYRSSYKDENGNTV